VVRDKCGYATRTAAQHAVGFTLLRPSDTFGLRIIGNHLAIERFLTWTKGRDY
jgi:hypothetical protein